MTFSLFPRFSPERYLFKHINKTSNKVPYLRFPSWWAGFRGDRKPCRASMKSGRRICSTKNFICTWKLILSLLETDFIKGKTANLFDTVESQYCLVFESISCTGCVLIRRVSVTQSTTTQAEMQEWQHRAPFCDKNPACDSVLALEEAWSTIAGQPPVSRNQIALSIAMPIHLDLHCFHTRIAELRVLQGWGAVELGTKSWYALRPMICIHTGSQIILTNCKEESLKINQVHTFCVSSFFSCLRMSVKLMSFSIASTCLFRCFKYIPHARQ